MTDSITEIYTERRRTYHMMNAIAETALTEKNISGKLRQLIFETQKEVEELYLLVSHDMHSGLEKNNEITIKTIERKF